MCKFFWAGETIKEFLNQGKQSTQNININGSIPVKIEKESK
jgi:transcriptional regulator of met regulon